ncbi:MAG: hypothetical protein Q7R79_04845 [bacterium]|nr:hypothetical protein [bacterium]
MELIKKTPTLLSFSHQRRTISFDKDTQTLFTIRENDKIPLKKKFEEVSHIQVHVWERGEPDRTNMGSQGIYERLVVIFNDRSSYTLNPKESSFSYEEKFLYPQRTGANLLREQAVEISKFLSKELYIVYLDLNASVQVVTGEMPAIKLRVQPYTSEQFPIPHQLYLSRLLPIVFCLSLAVLFVTFILKLWQITVSWQVIFGIIIGGSALWQMLSRTAPQKFSLLEFNARIQEKEVLYSEILSIEKGNNPFDGILGLETITIITEGRKIHMIQGLRKSDAVLVFNELIRIHVAIQKAFQDRIVVGKTLLSYQ